MPTQFVQFSVGSTHPLYQNDLVDALSSALEHLPTPPGSVALGVKASVLDGFGPKGQRFMVEIGPLAEVSLAWVQAQIDALASVSPERAPILAKLNAHATLSFGPVEFMSS
ncbi:hypothetical protein [Deinococcus multiflagellatus]|uniref:Uncharacterized protein n=1 Tax=Deinococcus multiflagellatus TaxID=1656887 RepID=A0ABW1ZQE6_9DEIO|nr:hypothetical protein [Deinococcus multiflagellatus]MBZ9715831.1 hypothetical protein [Deinococcus multiflagellatus]